MIQPLQPLQLQSLGLGIDFAGIALTGTAQNEPGKRFYVSVVDSIARILSTRLGERVMRPEFGSDLYLLRDRNFDASWRVRATGYIFEAIQRDEPRVAFKQLHFDSDAITGRHSFYIEIDPRRV
ncbi:MAG: GPW/gp25 family protein [Mariprofundus sp.]|nr:GPW/gp25 family protein [Mariprofundus sp.]